MNAINPLNDENESLEWDEYIVSLSWKHSVLSAVYFNTKTLDVSVVSEIDDFKPGFSYTANLIRQLSPMIILASGTPQFQNEILRFCNYPPNTDISKFKYSANQMPTTSDKKHLQKCHQRILSLELPEMPNNLTDIEKINFMETFISSHQDQLVVSFGNLLIYLDAMWKHLFHTNEIIADYCKYQCSSTRLQHPSGFKIGTEGASKEGFSLFSLLNRCHSKIGKKFLKCLMQQPTWNLEELNSRLDTINWVLDKKNSNALDKIKLRLKKTGNMNEDYARLIRNPISRKDWQAFQLNSLSLCCVCQLSFGLVQKGEENVLLNQLSVQAEERSVLLCVCSVISKMIQLGQNDGHIIPIGFDQRLDDIRAMENNVRETIYHKFTELVLKINLKKYTITHFAEVGYVLGVSFGHRDQKTHFDARAASNQLEFLLETQNVFFYKFNRCHELNASYKELNVRIRCQEEQILKEFLNWYAPHVPVMHYYTELYAKLDCLIGFAEIAEEFNLVRPELTTDKMLQIVQGRHFLFESNKKLMPNDTIVMDNRFVTLLMAPNAAGKSFYLKQVGLIVYMAHIGSFVPAKKAKIGLVKEIFSRLYTEESIHNNQSSFQSELIQMSRILTCSTDRSLILIDEFGKGTNLINGKSILLACIEHLLERKAAMPITFLSTHYMEVFEYFGQSEWLATKTFEMYRHENGSIFSTHQLIDGRGMQSYAHQCEEVKVFLDWILKQSTESGSGSSDFAVDSFSEEVNDIYMRKIEFSTKKFTEFLLNGEKCSADTFRQLIHFNVSNKDKN